MLSLVAAVAAAAVAALPAPTAVVGYRSEAALQRALRAHPATVVRRIPALRAVEVRPSRPAHEFAAQVARLPGIAYASAARARARRALDPATTPAALGAGAYEWQWTATRADEVPADVRAAAAAVTIAVVDTGVDDRTPDLAGKIAGAWDVAGGRAAAPDGDGHGTFVASLAAGAPGDGVGVAGFGGDARVLAVRAARSGARFSDADEAAAVVWAVDHGARVVNLSFGGAGSSRVERDAIAYAVARGVLLVAAAGNGRSVEYPAALLGPRDGGAGAGLAVGASDGAGAPAPFSPAGGVSLLAPGVDVVGAVPAAAGSGAFAPVALPGPGRFAVASGTSFAAPQVAGAAALVWAANPSLDAAGVARILRETASPVNAPEARAGAGVLDVAAAVGRARGLAAPAVALRSARGRRHPPRLGRARRRLVPGARHPRGRRRARRRRRHGDERDLPWDERRLRVPRRRARRAGRRHRRLARAVHAGGRTPRRRHGRSGELAGRAGAGVTASAPPAGQNGPVGSGYVGILSVELHFPEAGSLKGKRRFVKSAKAQLQNRFGAAVAEVDHHELWQRSRLTAAVVAREQREAVRLLDEAERYLNGQEYVLVRAERDLVTLDG